MSILPSVTILMPVRNAERFVGTALRSILRQQLRDFELLVLDDDSSDATVRIVESLGDPRVRVIRHEQRRGIAGLLNEGIQTAKADLIARIDGDDVARSARLILQKSHMENHPHLAAVGTDARFFGREPWVRAYPPSGTECVRAFMVFDNALLHPTVMFRKSILREHGLGYRQEFSKSEDYDLWERLSQVAPMDNLDTVTMHIRVHPDSVTTSPGNVMEDQTKMILSRGLARLGVEADSEMLNFHRRVGHGVRMETTFELDRAWRWICNLMDANQRSGAYPDEGFRKAAAIVWFGVCRNSAQLGLRAWRIWRTTRFAKPRLRIEELAWFWAGMTRHAFRS